MKGKNAIYLLLGLIFVFVVIRFAVDLFKDGAIQLPPKGFSAPIQFPICQGSKENQAIKAIQTSLNKTMIGSVKKSLEVDGVFAGLTEFELKDQTGSICVSKDMYSGMV